MKLIDKVNKVLTGAKLLTQRIGEELFDENGEFDGLQPAYNVYSIRQGKLQLVRQYVTATEVEVWINDKPVGIVKNRLLTRRDELQFKN